MSEEIIVYGESGDGGGGGSVDVIALDAWMFQFDIQIFRPRIILPPKAPPGDDTVDPCTLLAQSLNSLEASRAADETAIKALDELIADADDNAEKRALREEKRKARRSLKETERLIEDVKDEMAETGC